VAGGGAYSQDGDVITFLNNHPEYTDAFPPLALFVGLATDLGVNGQFVGGLFATSAYNPSLENLLASGPVNYTWNWNDLSLTQIISVESSPTPPPSLTIALGENPLDPTLSFLTQYVFDFLSIGGEEDLFVKTSYGAVLGIPLNFLGDIESEDIYWLFGLIANDVTDASIFGVPQPFGEQDLAFFISSSHGSGDLQMSAVPLPGAVWFFGTGLLGLAGLGRRLHRRG
jgi:hypothetical protein